MTSIIIYDEDTKDRTGIKWLLENSAIEIDKIEEAKNSHELITKLTRMDDNKLCIIFNPFTLTETELTHISNTKIKNNYIKLIAISQLEGIEDFKKILHLELFDHIKKPPDPNQVLTSISSAFHKLDKQIKFKKSKEVFLINYHTSFDFVYNLIFSNFNSIKQIYEYAQALGFQLLPNLAIVADIDNFYYKTKNTSEQFKFKFRNKIFHQVEKIIAPYKGSAAAPLGKEKIVILTSLPVCKDNEEFSVNCLTLTEKLQKRIAQNTDCTLTIGVGKQQDTRNLHLSYQEAVSASEHKFFKGNNQVLFYHQETPLSKTLPYQDYELETIVLDKIKLGDLSEALNAFEHLFGKCFYSVNTKPWLLKIKTIQFITTIMRVAAEKGVDSEIVFNFNAKWTYDIIESDYISDLKIIIEKAIEDAINYVSQGKNQQNSRVIKRACKYIDYNYNKNISLNDIAEVVCLNPYYISHIFKKEIGISFIEYLTYKRMQKAKYLLLDTNETISEIAIRVGYSDPNYFSRVFKKYFGSPPSNFRK
ncbi:helix-turn-helix domain-containing protein [Natranaerobius trueperi]|uniref:HTH araC/xylS-type domain-containing protein n=1 Tax=Natranaerobius trueperi TaxID=759412 RepID=A0A226C0V6_9FIRM|nr:helix-turn-helix domain-containing protein [Natranaerobius trueperi]OWZ84079.1 hypothetical protein CDO51_05025 [Natranaerobius trueperi]